MITLSFADFYGGDWVDEGYELYVLKDVAGAVIYVGISRSSVWGRWFGGLTSHMEPLPDGSLRGISRVGEALALRLPDSWRWQIELWTRDDCEQSALKKGIKIIFGRKVQNLGILDFEAYLIQTEEPFYNVMHSIDTNEPALVSVSQGMTNDKPSDLLESAAATTIDAALKRYVDSLFQSHSANSARTYANAAKTFRSTLQENDVDPSKSPAGKLSEDTITWLIQYLKDVSPATERLYVQATVGFFEFLAAERIADVNLPRLKLLVRQRARRPGVRLPQFPTDDIARLLKHAEDPLFVQQDDEQERLRALRDRAFLLTLADTGLRVHEACKLRRGDVDINEGQALVIGKGDTEAVVRFSARSLKALRDYLSARAKLDGSSGKPLGALPLFARHDKGAGKKVKPITTETGRNIVRERVAQALGDTASGRITPTRCGTTS